MNELQTTIQGMSIQEICTRPDQYPDEVVAAAFDALKEIKSQIRDYEVNISGNMIRRMREDNATKIPFVGVDGERKFLTLKKGAMKVNPAIRNIEEYINQAGLTPEMIGDYKYTLFSWGKLKESRKMGGDLQLIIDEIYIEGTPSLTVTE